MREAIKGSDGKIIAWGEMGCKGPNGKCRAGFRANRPYHIIPAHTDPRAETVQIALPSYHYASRDDALAALENAWNTAETVDNPIDRDNAYARKVPVKILKNTGNF